MFAQILTITIQLVSVPLFLSIWSNDVYGVWLILSVVPTYIAMSDFGIMLVTINKLTMLAPNRHFDRNVIFQTSVKLCLYLFIIVALFSSLFVSVFGPYIVFLDDWENRLAVISLSLVAVLALSGRLVDAVYRSNGQFAKSVYLLNSVKLVEWVGLITGLYWGQTYLTASLGMLAGRLIGTIYAISLAKKQHKSYQWSIKLARHETLKNMLKPAFAFMAFPAANALTYQGVSIVVASIFGPGYLVVFSIYRTLSRTLVQGVSVIIKALEPEISKQFGTQSIASIMNMYSKTKWITILLTLLGGLALLFFGESVLALWVGDKVGYEFQLFSLFVLSAALNAVWQLDLSMMTSINRHMTMSVIFFTVSVLLVSSTFLLQDNMGEFGPPLLMVLFDLTLCILTYLSMKKVWLKYEKVND